MPPAPMSATSHGTRPRNAQTLSATQTSSEVPAAMRKRPMRSVWRSSAGKNSRPPCCCRDSERSSLIAQPPSSYLSVFYRHRVHRTPQIPGGDRAPGAPAFAKLAHPGEGNLSSLEVVGADTFLQPEVVQREHVGPQQ